MIKTSSPNPPDSLVARTAAGFLGRGRFPFEFIFPLLTVLLFCVPAGFAHGSDDVETASGLPPSSRAHAQVRKKPVKHAPRQGKRKPAGNGLSGMASYYKSVFHGRKTASGHPYYKDAMTAAHRSLPLGTWVRVTNDRNGNYVVVQITDRGPYSKKRVVDVSRAAAEELGMLHSGTAPVHLEVVQDYPQAR